MGVPFYFNMNDWNTPEAEQEHLTAHMPRKMPWVYPHRFLALMVWRGMRLSVTRAPIRSCGGYVYMELNTAEDGTEPTDEEVCTEIDRLLLVTENRARTLLGVETIDPIEHPYAYEVDETGAICLLYRCFTSGPCRQRKRCRPSRPGHDRRC